MILSGLPAGPDKRRALCVHPLLPDIVAAFPACPHHRLFATFLACR
ncbi:hypothetical protein UYSO10_2810 [Kosakonia radicincitans]|nr:hypothetical protein UYSO10_2810 [Kosakonia radicincitans]